MRDKLIVIFNIIGKVLQVYLNIAAETQQIEKKLQSVVAAVLITLCGIIAIAISSWLLLQILLALWLLHLQFTYLECALILLAENFTFLIISILYIKYVIRKLKITNQLHLIESLKKIISSICSCKTPVSENSE